MIIGLTGTKASGKGIIAEILREKGFAYSSTSDRVREEALKRGLENYTIKDLQDIGNDLRERFGTDILAKRTLERLKDFENIIIDGIRNLGEIENLKKHNAIIIGVDAPQKQRFERLLKRQRVSDPKNWQEFLAMESRDLGQGENQSGQQTRECIENSDYRIINDGTPEELKQKIEYLFMKLNLKKDDIKKRELYIRPTWDQYFMKMAALVAERSTCLRHHIGAVIVKNERVLTTGYNGSAKGMPNCNEVGCLKDERKIESGVGHEICRAIHAEQNAIIQAGLHGINIDGSTMYSTHTPCGVCAKLIVNAGIKRVVSYHDYTDAEARIFLNEAGIELIKVPKPENIISFRD